MTETSFATPSDREVAFTRVVAAPRQRVFEAWTQPQFVAQWLLGPAGWTMPVCEIDLRTGGQWRYVWRRFPDTEMAIAGSFREVLPPERVVTVERWGPEWPETVNTLALRESGGRTTITLTILYPSKSARDAALATGMRAGMEPNFARLDELLRTLTSPRGPRS
jgi:uncharacterized protein YndB with AHSA1/START domain